MGSAVKVFLAPGATGGVESLRPYVDGLAACVEAYRVALPRGSAERAVPVYLEQSVHGASPLRQAYSFSA